MEMVLLTTAQLAKRLGIAPITLQIWRSQGIGIPFVKQGTQVFYRLTTSDNRALASCICHTCMLNLHPDYSD